MARKRTGTTNTTETPARYLSVRDIARELGVSRSSGSPRSGRPCLLGRGHLAPPKESQMLSKYRRQFESAAELNLGRLHPLAEAVPELAVLTAEARKCVSKAQQGARRGNSNTRKARYKAEVAEWQTRRTQNPLSARV